MATALRTSEDPNEAPSQALGRRIRELRVKAGMTQREVGDAMDVESNQVARWERGFNSPRTNQLPKLEEVLRAPSGSLGIPVGRTLQSALAEEKIFGLEKRAMVGDKAAVLQLVSHARKLRAACWALLEQEGEVTPEAMIKFEGEVFAAAEVEI